MASPVLFVAFLGGLLPSLLWLGFWLLEDRCEPEPKRYLFLSFLAGMIAVIFVLPLEQYAYGYLTGTMLLFVWAIIEEVFKLGAAWIALRSRAFDEPIDAVIYLVTAALGFSAAENMLFLWGPLQDGEFIKTLITGDLRFIGATLLHTLASATIGLSIAMSYFRPRLSRRLFLAGGVILAILLHTIFNFFILGSAGATTFSVFVFIWVGIICLLFAIERIKNPARDYC